MAICRVIVSKISKMQDVLECSQRISLSVHWRPSRYFFVSRLERFSVRYSNCLVEGHESAWLRKNHAMFSNFFSYPHGPIANFIGQSRCGVEDAGRWESAHCLSPKYVIQRWCFFSKKKFQRLPMSYVLYPSCVGCWRTTVWFSPALVNTSSSSPRFFASSQFTRRHQNSFTASIEDTYGNFDRPQWWFIISLHSFVKHIGLSQNRIEFFLHHTFSSQNNPTRNHKTPILYQKTTIISDHEMSFTGCCHGLRSDCMFRIHAV